MKSYYHFFHNGHIAKQQYSAAIHKFTQVENVCIHIYIYERFTNIHITWPISIFLAFPIHPSSPPQWPTITFVTLTGSVINFNFIANNPHCDPDACFWRVMTGTAGKWFHFELIPQFKHMSTWKLKSQFSLIGIKHQSHYKSK